MTSNDLPKIIAILGPTASGKTGMSIELAHDFNGEIICLDSRTIYKGLDIGSAKPTQEEMRGIPHHLIDVSTPDRILSLSEIKKIAEAKISDIISRGRTPFLVGGTALYAYAILENWLIPEIEPDAQLRQSLEERSLEDLVSILEKEFPDKYESVDLKNKRRVIRAIEVGDNKPTIGDKKYNAIKIGISRDEKYLRESIQKRTQKMLDDGLIYEVQNLILKYDRNLPAFTGIHYKEIIDYLDNKISLNDALQLINTHDWQLTRRQMTWLKRDNEINWVQSVEEAEKIIKAFMK